VRDLAGAVGAFTHTAESLEDPAGNGHLPVRRNVNKLLHLSTTAAGDDSHIVAPACSMAC